jgi:hypothetical protein
MMCALPLQDLKLLGPDQQVPSICCCQDTYHVMTGAAEMLPSWDFNLRLKRDSKANGPANGRPVLLSAGVMSNRAFVVFAASTEIRGLIQSNCEE